MRIISYRDSIYRRKVVPSGDSCDYCDVERSYCSDNLTRYCSNLDLDKDNHGCFRLCKKGVQEVD